MPRDRAKTRERILNAAYVLFHRKGFDRIGVGEIAAAATVTKRTLYNHFKSKDALLAECLKSQNELALAGFKSWGDRLSGSCEPMIDEMFAELYRWSAKPRWSGSGFTRVAMELADLPGHPARVMARQHKARLGDYLTELLDKADVESPREKARTLWILSEGAMILTLILGDRSYVATAQRAAKILVQTRPRRQKANRRVKESS
jgi:AcrR family transcriptional regulator